MLKISLSLQNSTIQRDSTIDDRPEPHPQNIKPTEQPPVMNTTSILEQVPVSRHFCENIVYPATFSGAEFASFLSAYQTQKSTTATQPPSANISPQNILTEYIHQGLVFKIGPIRDNLSVQLFRKVSHSHIEVLNSLKTFSEYAQETGLDSKIAQDKDIIAFFPQHFRQPNPTPVQLTTQLLTSIFTLFNLCSQPDFNQKKALKIWNYYKILLLKLEKVTFENFSEIDKIVFFLNIWHILILHSCIYIKPTDTSNLSIYRVEKPQFNASLLIGGIQFNSEFLLNSVFRSILDPIPFDTLATHQKAKKQKGSSTLKLLRKSKKPFSFLRSSDGSSNTNTNTTLSYTLSTFDPRIHFCLSWLKPDSPPIVIFNTENLEQMMAFCTRYFLSKNIIINQKYKTISLPSIFSVFREDFPGASHEDLFKYLSKFISPAQLSVFKKLLSDHGSLIILPWTTSNSENDDIHSSSAPNSHSNPSGYSSPGNSNSSLNSSPSLNFQSHSHIHITTLDPHIPPTSLADIANFKIKSIQTPELFSRITSALNIHNPWVDIDQQLIYTENDFGQTWLNSFKWSTFSYGSQTAKNPLKLSKQLLLLALYCLEKQSNPVYTQLTLWAGALSSINLQTVQDMTIKTRLCFFANIYHTMVIWLHILRGPNRSGTWDSLALSIGNSFFTVDDILWGIILGNRKKYMFSIGEKSTHFKKNDSRAALAISNQYYTPNLLFSLIWPGELAFPSTLCIFDPILFEKQQETLPSIYCKANIRVDLFENNFVIPKSFSIFKSAWSEPKLLIEWISNYASGYLKSLLAKYIAKPSNWDPRYYSSISEIYFTFSHIHSDNKQITLSALPKIQQQKFIDPFATDLTLDISENMDDQIFISVDHGSNINDIHCFSSLRDIPSLELPFLDWPSEFKVNSLFQFASILPSQIWTPTYPKQKKRKHRTWKSGVYIALILFNSENQVLLDDYDNLPAVSVAVENFGHLSKEDRVWLVHTCRYTPRERYPFIGKSNTELRRKFASATQLLQNSFSLDYLGIFHPNPIQLSTKTTLYLITRYVGKGMLDEIRSDIGSTGELSAPTGFSGPSLEVPFDYTFGGSFSWTDFLDTEKILYKSYTPAASTKKAILDLQKYNFTTTPVSSIDNFIIPDLTQIEESNANSNSSGGNLSARLHSASLSARLSFSMDRDRSRQSIDESRQVAIGIQDIHEDGASSTDNSAGSLVSILAQNSQHLDINESDEDFSSDEDDDNSSSSKTIKNKFKKSLSKMSNGPGHVDNPDSSRGSSSKLKRSDSTSSTNSARSSSSSRSLLKSARSAISSSQIFHGQVLSLSEYEPFSIAEKRSFWLRTHVLLNNKLTWPFSVMSPGIHLGYLYLCATAKSLKILVPKSSPGMIPASFISSTATQADLGKLSKEFYGKPPAWFKAEMNEANPSGLDLKQQILSKWRDMEAFFTFENFGTFMDFQLVNIDDFDAYSLFIVAQYVTSDILAPNVALTHEWIPLDLFEIYNSGLFSPLTFSFYRFHLASQLSYPNEQASLVVSSASIALLKQIQSQWSPLRWTILVTIWLSTGKLTLSQIISGLVKQVDYNKKVNSKNANAIWLKGLVPMDSADTYASCAATWKRTSSFTSGFRETILNLLETKYPMIFEAAEESPGIVSIVDIFAIPSVQKVLPTLWTEISEALINYSTICDIPLESFTTRVKGLFKPNI